MHTCLQTCIDVAKARIYTGTSGRTLKCIDPFKLEYASLDLWFWCCTGIYTI